MRAAEDQYKTACGKLQLCAGLKAGIEGETHALGQQRMEISRARHREGEASTSLEEEESESVAAGIENLSIERSGTEEEVTEGLEAALRMEIEAEKEKKDLYLQYFLVRRQAFTPMVYSVEGIP